MTALAADKKVNRKDGIYESYYVKAAQQIYLGAMVTVKASTGYAYAATDTAGDRFVGIAMENVLGVTDGVERVKVLRLGVVQLVGSGLAITDVGDPVWASDDQTVTTSAANVLVGTIVAVPSATAPWVAISPRTAIDSDVANFTASGTSAVTGNATFGGTVGVTGTLTGAGLITAADLTCTDDLTVGDDCAITGLCTIGETLGVTGIATFTGRPILPTVAFGSLGAATSAGQVCYCASGHGGLPGILVADGTNWIAPDGATAAET